MEWMNRGDRPGQPTGQPTQVATPVHAASPAKTQKTKLKSLRGMRLVQAIFLFLIAILVVAVVAYISVGGSKKTEASYIDNGKLQAVFLNGGQVYFGNIKDLNGKFLTLANIYYLRVNQQVQPNTTTNTNSNDVSLVKLGCELHGPTDSMVINREQVVFWENLKDDGQVAKAVAEYQKSNPGTQKCETSSQSTDASATDTSTQATTGTTNSTSTTNKSSGN